MTHRICTMVLLCAMTACGRRTRNEDNTPPPPTAPAPVAPAPVAPAPVATPEPAATPDASIAVPTPPTVEPPGAPEPPHAVDALSVGRHRCSFTEAGSSYNRRCEVSQMPDGSLEVVARGTSLNPQQGFAFNASGAAPRYSVRGELTAFGECNGRFTGTMTLQGPDSRPYYEVGWGQGCRITIQL